MTESPGARLARPTFVGIGAQKCASTWLHRILQEHPEVAVPEQKEVDFFSYRYDRGFQWYERQLMTGSRTTRIGGEISPSYLHEPAVPGRVALYAPEARILVSLRDPVQRALSNHRHEVRAGHVRGDLSLEYGLENNPMYIEQGLYATHLQRWLQAFPREQVLVFLQEDLAQDPLGVARDVFRFLGIDDSFRPTGLGERYNASYVSRFETLAQVKDHLYGATRLPGLRWAWQAAARLGLRSVYRGLNQRPSSTLIPPPRPETLRRLRERFEPEVRELERLIERPLAQWRREPTHLEAAA